MNDLLYKCVYCFLNQRWVKLKIEIKRSRILFYFFVLFIDRWIMLQIIKEMFIIFLMFFSCFLHSKFDTFCQTAKISSRTWLNHTDKRAYFLYISIFLLLNAIYFRFCWYQFKTIEPIRQCEGKFFQFKLNNFNFLLLKYRGYFTKRFHQSEFIKPFQYFQMIQSRKKKTENNEEKEHRLERKERYVEKQVTAKGTHAHERLT